MSARSHGGPPPAGHPHADFPATWAPPRGSVPHFPPIHTGRGRRSPLLRGVRRHRHRLAATVLAAACAATLAWAPRGDAQAGAEPPASPSSPAREKAKRRQTVSAPVRVSDAAVAGLLRPGDRVDVIAARGGHPAGSAPTARVVARDALVKRLPESEDSEGEYSEVKDSRGPRNPHGPRGGPHGPRGGALVLLEVPREAATRLAGAAAAAGSRLTVSLR